MGPRRFEEIIDEFIRTYSERILRYAGAEVSKHGIPHEGTPASLVRPSAQRKLLEELISLKGRMLTSREVDYALARFADFMKIYA